VLWGTLFPVLSEWVTGSKVTVGPPFFNRVNSCGQRLWES
jgi:cytochrome c-type biogenesis protein CcmF